eukprot:CAMPEP_0184745650 /NCGR_PEP_ID=MMETSP0315-20130426/8323_1 /TAXON_ID=101924 /ORGANISM="Rhodosorus marinus, Strain UTEX LB 2760" /LENGTH=86 /DNA_ID=CAMNT_0027217911 /DNA_START=339 /DNA_END=596 /DNA_ORIENTATION=-
MSISFNLDELFPFFKGDLRGGFLLMHSDNNRYCGDHSGGNAHPGNDLLILRQRPHFHTTLLQTLKLVTQNSSLTPARLEGVLCENE